MDLQRENDSELNLPEDSRRQQRKGKGMKRSILQTEQEVSSVEIEFQNASEDLQWNDKQHCKDSPPTPEKLVAGILGVICFILLFTVVRIIPWSQTAIAETQTTGNQKAIHSLSSAYHCGRCPAEWVMYSNHCYYISPERKTWTESLTACASQNSSLLHVDDKEEMNFMHIFNILVWIGVSHRNNNNSGLWKSGSVFFSKIYSKTSELDKNCTFGNFEAQKLYFESCLEKKHYVCKHQALWLI